MEFDYIWIGVAIGFAIVIAREFLIRARKKKAPKESSAESDGQQNDGKNWVHTDDGFPPVIFAPFGSDDNIYDKDTIYNKRDLERLTGISRGRIRYWVPSFETDESTVSMPLGLYFYGLRRAVESELYHRELPTPSVEREGNVRNYIAVGVAMLNE